MLTNSHFNGKIDAPRLYDRALSSDEIGALARGGDSLAVAGLVAAWDFSKDISTTRVTDVGPHGIHGSAVQMPTRGVTGHNHTGRETNFRLAPDEYGAIHFHDDDLEDALWNVDFELTVPDDLRSGVYAAWVRSGDDEDYITFFVRPTDGAKTAAIGVLMSTVSYVTYANFRDVDGGFWNPERVPNADPSLNPASHEFLRANQMPGLYDFHTDGTGAALCSWRRPILNMRATYRYRVWSAPSRFPADLYMIDWLEARGLAYDVITDHDLHAQGAELLNRHRVIISGSHPEYWTTPMIQGLETYLNDGGSHDVPGRQRILRRHRRRPEPTARRRGAALGHELAFRACAGRAGARHDRRTGRHVAQSRPSAPGPGRHRLRLGRLRQGLALLSAARQPRPARGVHL